MESSLAIEETTRGMTEPNTRLSGRQQNPLFDLLYYVGCKRLFDEAKRTAFARFE